MYSRGQGGTKWALRVWDQLCRSDTPFWFVCQACNSAYNLTMEKKIFWIVFMVLGLVADVVLPLWWGVAATIPILFFSWWVAYRSDWF
jgi:hypothetical protein